jgi:hypothetical protein
MATIPPLVITEPNMGSWDAGSAPTPRPSGRPSGPGWCCWPPRASPTARSPPWWPGTSTPRRTGGAGLRPNAWPASPTASGRAGPGLRPRPAAADPGHRDPAPPDPASHWSHSQLAKELADMGISASQIGRILADLDIKPHRCAAGSPALRTLASGSGPPTAAGCTWSHRQARWCSAWMRRPACRPAAGPGRPGRLPGAARPAKHTRTAARHRHLAGRPGRRWRPELHRHRPGPHHRGQLHRLPRGPGRQGPSRAPGAPGLEGGACHIARDTRWWFLDHPRFHPTTPQGHAAWLNQVELFFSILARRLLKRGEFGSVEDLVAKVMAFIADDNRTATPFRWTYDGRPSRPADMPTTNAELH